MVRPMPRCRVCISALRVSGLQLVWGVFEPCHELVREVVELGVGSARGSVFTRVGDGLEGERPDVRSCSGADPARERFVAESRRELATPRARRAEVSLISTRTGPRALLLWPIEVHERC